MDKKKLLEMTRGVEIEDLSQVSQPDEREVTINIMYSEPQEIWIYTNNATVFRRILRKGFIPTKVEYLQSRPDMPYCMDFRLPISELGQFVRTGIFK